MSEDTTASEAHSRSPGGEEVLTRKPEGQEVLPCERLELRVSNLDCKHDAVMLRRALKNASGVSDIDVLPSSGAVVVRFNPEESTAEMIRQTLVEAGFPPRQVHEAAQLPLPWHNAKVVTSAAAGILLLVGWLVAMAVAPGPVSVSLYLAAMGIGGYYFGREALEELFLEREIGIELLMSVAAVVAAAMGQPGEGAMLVFLYSISEAAEGYTAEKTRSAIRALMKLAPRTAIVRRGESEVEVPVEELSPGDVFLVRYDQMLWMRI